MVGVDVTMFIDKSTVFQALDRKRRTVLARTGGYTRTSMRNSMKRAPKKKRIQRAVDEDGREILFDRRGRMHTADGRFLPREHAAKIIKRQRTTTSSREGQPPYYREGSLRRLIYFGYDPNEQSIVTGPTLFKPSKVRPAHGKTTPELINEGGFANVLKPGGGNIRTEYKPRPFTPPAAAKGSKFFHEQIEKSPFK